METVTKLIALLTGPERRTLLLLTFAAILMAFVQVAGIGALGLFMAVVADQAAIAREPLLRFLYSISGLTDLRSFIVLLGILVFVVVLLGNVFRMLGTYGIYRYAGMRRYSMGRRLFRRYLHQPYSYYLGHNSSELSKNLLQEVDYVVDGVLIPAMEAVARAVLVLVVVVFLFLTDPLVAGTAAVVLSSLNFAVYRLLRPQLTRYGEQMRFSNARRYKASGEAFGAIKEVKIRGTEPVFEAAYARGARDFAVSRAAQTILTVIPKEALEAVTFGLIVVLVVGLLLAGDAAQEILPLLAVFGFAAYRIMPSMQVVLQGFSRARYYSPTVSALYDDMFGSEDGPAPLRGRTAVPDDSARESSGALSVKPFTRRLALDSIFFAYDASAHPVLSDITLEIEKDTTVGFVGRTGCGKTTLVDLMMGLLEPRSGRILVDGAPLGQEVGPWQRNFGYVPQQIFLSDDTIAANIAFGVPEEERDTAAIENAARLANFHAFITQELPHGYNTEVGERGIRLSGGQRQRIGIARALYHDPAILVMDEATSALDSVTERAVMDAIHNLMHRKTLIMIAHRLTTLEACDVIYLMQDGRIADRGTYDELVLRNPEFKAMARTGLVEQAASFAHSE